MTGLVIFYLAAVALGLPRSFPEASGLAGLGSVMFPLFVAAVTTNILPIDILRKWKFILIGCSGVIVSLLVVLLVGGIFLDKQTLFTGAMVVSGGAFTGSLLVTDYLRGTEFQEVITLALLLATTIDAIGQPIGSLVIKKYIKRQIASDAYLSAECIPETDSNDGKLYNTAENPSPWFRAWIPPRYETNIVALFQLALITTLSYWLGDFTGLGWAFMLIILGLAGSFFGFFRINMLNRTHSSGLMMCAIFTMIFDMLNDLTIESVISQLIPFIIVVPLGLLGLILGGLLGAKLLGYDPWLGAACTIGLFYFFPGTQTVINEVVRSHARNAEEHNYLIDHITSPALITAFMGSRIFLFIGSLLMPVFLR